MTESVEVPEFWGFAGADILAACMIVVLCAVCLWLARRWGRHM